MIYLRRDTLNMEQLTSPRIKKLVEEIKNDVNNVVDIFWTSIEKEGAPLIEEIQGDKDNVLITFLFRAKKDINSVLIYGAFPGFRYSENLMEQLYNTDIWFKTYKVRNDIKFKYNFSINYEFDNDYNKVKERSQADSLNPNKIVLLKDEENPQSEETINSLVELVNTKPEIWIKPKEENEKGEVDLHRFHSEILSDTRRIWIYTPYNYTKCNSSCNLLMLTDGFNYINYLSAEIVLNNLIKAKEIPPTICVFVESTNNRYDEFTCNDSFSDFLAKELIPWVRENYNVTLKSEETVIGGISLGALAATYVALKNPNLFGNVLSQSASYWWQSEWLTRQYEKSDRLPLNFYLNTGILEGRPYDDEPVMMEVIKNMRNTLLAKGYKVSYEEFQSGHDYLSWGETLASGLIALIGNK